MISEIDPRGLEFTMWKINNSHKSSENITLSLKSPCMFTNPLFYQTQAKYSFKIVFFMFLDGTTKHRLYEYKHLLVTSPV